MALVQIIFRSLQCDGCKTLLEGGKHYKIAAEARGIAYGFGWRFVPRLTASGKESSMTSDVCPECIPTFKPQKDGSHKYKEK